MGAYHVIAAIDDVEWELYDAGIVSAEQHARFTSTMLETLREGRAFNALVLALPDDGVVSDEDVAPVSRALTDLLHEVTGWPGGEARAQLEPMLELAIRTLARYLQPAQEGQL